MIDLDFGPPAGEEKPNPSLLADELEAGLQGRLVETDQPKRKGGWPKGKPRGTRKPQEIGQPGQESGASNVVVPEFKMDPGMLTDAIHGVGKAITDRTHTTEYQKTEAESIAKILAPMIDYLLKSWGASPAAAPWVALIIIILTQTVPRYYEYQFKKAVDKPEGLPKPEIVKPSKMSTSE